MILGPVGGCEAVGALVFPLAIDTGHLGGISGEVLVAYFVDAEEHVGALHGQKLHPK